MTRVRPARGGPGWRKCDGCKDIHLNAAFSEIIEEGKSKGRLRCAMCTAIEAKQANVKIERPKPCQTTIQPNPTSDRPPLLSGQGALDLFPDT